MTSFFSWHRSLRKQSGPSRARISARAKRSCQIQEASATAALQERSQLRRLQTEASAVSFAALGHCHLMSRQCKSEESAISSVDLVALCTSSAQPSVNIHQSPRHLLQVLP